MKLLVLLAALTVGNLSVWAQAKGTVGGTAASQVISGRITTIFGHPENGQPTEWPALQTRNYRFYRLEGGQNFSAAHGQIVKIRGRVSGDRIVVETMSFKAPPRIAPSLFPAGRHEFDVGANELGPVFPGFLTIPPATTGTRSVYIVNVNFTNNTTQPVTSEQVYTVAGGEGYSVNNFFKASSYNSANKFDLNVTVHPVWVTISSPEPACFSVTTMTGSVTNAVNAAMAGNSNWQNAKTRVINFTTIAGWELMVH